MLVVLIVLVMDAKMVLSFMPILSLNTISKTIPKINKTEPVIIDTFKYFVVSMSFLIVWDSIINNPRRPKNIMSFPLDDPIKKM